MMFVRPGLGVLGGLVVALVLVSVFLHARRRARLAAHLGGGRASRRVGGPNLYRGRAVRGALLGAGSLAVALAAAEPRRPSPPTMAAPDRAEMPVVLALDVSASMQASDVEPTRVARAVEIAAGLVEGASGSRVGVLLFAGRGYVLAPPTADLDAAAFLVRGIEPGTASAQDPGSLLSVALREGAALLAADAPVSGGQLVLISDGEAGEQEEGVLAAARAVSAEGWTIHTIGVGTSEGGEVPMRGAARSTLGRRQISRLQEPLLQRIAGVGDGVYAHSGDDASLRGLGEALAGGESGRSGGPVSGGRPDVGVWLITAALALLLAEGLLEAAGRVRRDRAGDSMGASGAGWWLRKPTTRGGTW